MAVNPSDQISKVMTKMKDKNPQSLLGMLIFAIFLIFAFPIFLQVRLLGSLNPRIKTLSEELHTAKNNIARLPQYQQQIKDLEVKLDQINHKIKSREEVPLVLENISRVADANGVKIEQVMPNTAAEQSVLQNEDGQYFSIPIVVEAKSGYHNFGRFLNQLETREVFLSIPEFTIAANSGEQTQHAIKLTIDAIIFEKVRK